MNTVVQQLNGSQTQLANITESGNRYIRFSDGIQICYDKDLEFEFENGATKKYIDITYPKKFISTPYISVTNEASCINIDNIITDSIMDTVRLVSYDGILTNLEMCRSIASRSGFTEKFTYRYGYIAIGRWK